MSKAKKLAAYWDWKAGAVVPDARIVVCAPEMLTTARLSVRADAFLFREQSRPAVKALDALIGAEDAGTLFVVPDGDPRGLGAGCVPALHITRQADLARLPGLLAVKAERRALVVSPEEAIDLVAGGALGCNCPDDERCWGTCAFYRSWPSGVAKRRIDVVFIVGGDAPVHPDWVRTIVEQCRAVHVPVVFMTWGAWLPQSQGSGPFQPTSYVFLNRDGRIDKTGHSIVTNMGWVGVGRVDGERSGHVVDNRIIRGAGALLDGKPIEDVPAWLGGVK